MTALALAVVLGPAARASDSFLGDLRKARARSEPSEQREYYGRAIAAWSAADGSALLAAARFGRGRAEYELDEPADAAADLSEALTLDPNNDAAYLFRGKALLRLSRSSQAARDLSAYTSLKPEDEEGWLALAQAQGDAAAPYREAARLDASDFRPIVGLARSAASAKRYREAVRLLGGLRQPQALSVRAQSEAALGNTPAALSDYDAALKAFDSEIGDKTRDEAAPVELAVLKEQAERARSEWEALRGRAAKAAPQPKARKKTRVKEDRGERIYAN